MSRYAGARLAALTPYVPGEQPREGRFIKLNTNENPYPPSEAALAWAREHARSMELYSDPQSTGLRAELARTYGVAMENVAVGNGSDDTFNLRLTYGGCTLILVK